MDRDVIGALLQAANIVVRVVAHPANRRQPLARALARALGWQWHKRRAKTPRCVPYHGQRLMLWPDSEQSSAVVYFDGWPDYWEMKFIAAYLRPGDRVLDIGANVGVYTVFLAGLVGGGGRVDAFEPVAESRARLLEQCRLNGFRHVHVEPRAVSDCSGTVRFTTGGSTAMRRIDVGESSASSVAVEAIRLDDWPGWQSYALVKIDIEGAEPLALAGAAHRLRTAPPAVILLELAGYAQQFGYSSDQVLDLLARHGYRSHVYDVAGNTLIEAPAPWRLGVTNVLAVHVDHHAAVQARLHEHRPLARRSSPVTA